MKICVIGLGYIGLPTSAMFASHGCQVLGVDVNPRIVETLNRGDIHIEEPGLGERVRSAVAEGRFRAALRPEEADAFIIAVPTPNLDDGLYSCDLGYVLAAARSIVPVLRKGNVVIVESTVGPRTTDDEVLPIFRDAGFAVGEDFYLAHCPERVLPGQILHELVHNNRIVGGVTPACTEAAARIYARFVQGELIRTEAKTAEMSKCMENTFRDVNIALANELARICFRLDIDCLDVIRMANKHPRVHLHQPGPGVGGHCLAIDPYFIYAKAPETARIIKLARDTNRAMPHQVIEWADMLLSGIDRPKIAVFGVTYKGNVDDTRESPGMEIAEALWARGDKVAVFDPHVADDRFVSLGDAVDGAHLVLVLADHNEFKAMDHGAIAARMARPLLFDTKNVVREQPGSGLPVVNFGNLYRFRGGDGP